MTLPITRSQRVYVDQTAPAGGNGSKEAPFTHIDYAAVVLSTIRKVSGIIFVKAPADAPFQGSQSVTANFPLTIAPWGPERWHMNGGTGSFALRVLGTAPVNLHRGIIVGNGAMGVRLGDTASRGGYLRAYDTYAEGQQSGWQTAGVFDGFDAWRCQGKGITNDGFNIHGDPGVTAWTRLYDCVGTECGDEGVSPHDDTRLHVYGGNWSDNGGGGMNAVNQAVANISRSLTTGLPAVMDRNGRIGETLYGGIGYWDTASGVIDGAVARNNTGPGFQNNGTGIVTKTDLVSAGNGAPDIG